MITDNQFPTASTGEFRDMILRTMRLGLLVLVNPQTGVRFTPDEVALATQAKGEYWLRGLAVDNVLMLSQARADIALAAQDPETAGTGGLEVWGKLYTLPRLLAAGGSGPVNAPCPAQSTFFGSTTPGDPAAVWGISATGVRVQVAATVTTTIAGEDAALSCFALDSGTATNLPSGTQITWQNAPDQVTSVATASGDWRNGTPDESDRAWGQRIIRRIRNPEGAGNSAEIVGDLEDSTSSIARAFIWPCALFAGASVWSILAARGTVRGPLGRVPTAATLAIARDYVTQILPKGPGLYGVLPTGRASNLVTTASMPRGSSAGWEDEDPWPTQSGGVSPTVLSTSSPTHFVLAASGSLPPGVTQPSLMVWRPATCTFELLAVTSVTDSGGGHFAVILTTPPAIAFTGGEWISPAAAPGVASTIADAVQQYFDDLGPGELVAVNDSRAFRAARFPPPEDDLPSLGGAAVITYIQSALGGGMSTGALILCSLTDPGIPGDPIDGPRFLVNGQFHVSSL